MPALNICSPKTSGKAREKMSITVNIVKNLDFIFIADINNSDIEKSNNTIVIMRTIKGKYNP